MEALFSQSANNFSLRDKQIIEIDAETSINQAFATLITHKLHAAPVYDKEQQGYLGFFDINDVLNIAYDIDLVKQTMTRDEEKDKLKTSDLKMLDVFNKANKIRNPLMEAEWIAVGPNVKMIEVLELLSTRARRVPIVDSHSGKVVKLISQMDIVRALHTLIQVSRENELPKFLLECPLSTGIGPSKVICVTEDDEAREAFKRMIDHNISCVAVVDDANKLCGVISNMDISVVVNEKKPPNSGNQQNAANKHFNPMMMGQAHSRPRGRFSIATGMGTVDYLGMLSMQFVGEVRKASEGPQGGRKEHVAVCEVSMETPFRTIVEMIYRTGMHRVFLVDANKAPVGIVSVSDICKLCLRELKGATASARKPPAIPKRESAKEEE